MRALQLARPGETLSVLCLGAHSDDIEIGAGGTHPRLGSQSGVRLEVHWCVLSAIGARAAEARGVGCGVPCRRRQQQDRARAVRGRLLSLSGARHQGLARRPSRAEVDPDVILTHRRDDAHQDHREVCQLTWNLFRDHLILEYEIPKWDGDLGQPNVYMPLPRRGAGAQDRASARPFRHASDPRTGSMRRPFAGWRACAAWNAARPSATPRPSSCARPGWGSAARRRARRGLSHAR